MIVEISRKDEDCLAERALDWWRSAYRCLTDITSVVCSAFLKMAHAQSFTLKVLLLT